MPRQRPRRIAVSFEGPPSDKGHLRIQYFIRKLEELKAALKQTERVVTGSDEPSVYWRIVDLRHSSPATVVLEEVPLDRDAQPTTPIVDRLAANFKRINKTAVIAKKEPPDLDLLQSYRALGEVASNQVMKVTIKSGKTTVSISQKFGKHLDQIIGPDQLETGSIAGMLEAINLHNTLRCNIYPIIGPKRVICHFDDEMKAKVIAGLGQYVRVVGTMSYKQWSSYPHAIDVTDIDVLPPDSDLPTLRDLRGLAPEATGEMTSEEFLEALRDGDW